MDQASSNIRVVFRSNPAPTEQRALQQSQNRSSAFGGQSTIVGSGSRQQKVSASSAGVFPKKTILPSAPYSSGAGSLAVLPDNRASNFGLSGSQRGRPRGRRPLRGQFPVVPMDMVRQLGIEQQVVLQPAAPVGVKNKGTLSKPLTLSRRVQCQPYRSEVACQTEDSLLLSAGMSAPVAVPVPVPFYIPIPMKMYSEPTPVAIPVPVPVPVPIVLLLDSNQAQDVNRQFGSSTSTFMETETAREAASDVAVVAPEAATETAVVTATATPSVTGTATATAVITGAGEEMTLVTETGEMLTLSQEQLRQLMGEDWTAEGVQSGDLEVLQENAAASSENVAAGAVVEGQQSEAAPSSSVGEQVIFVTAPSTSTAEPQAGEKRSAATARLADIVNSDVKHYRMSVAEAAPVTNDNLHRLKFSYGLKAWNHWMRTRYSELEISRSSTETDILRMPVEQLADAMSAFVRECRKPTGEEYTKDSVFYLCLGLQLYLNENGSEVNIFHDPLFESFSCALDSVIENYETRINAEGLLLCRIEEEHLWECRQLGAFPPATLIFTLMYFITKHFQVPTVNDHFALTSSQLVHVHQKPVAVLRYLPANQYSTALEISANEDMPLKCPVHLIEFYYAKCPPKNQRPENFYLTPDYSATMDSPVWFTNQALDPSELKRMLSRIRLVKEIQETYSTVAAQGGRQF